MEIEKKKKSGRSNLLFVIFLCAAWFAIGWFFHARVGSAEAEIVEAAFSTIVNEALYFTGEEDQLAYAAVRGMLDETGDPYGELLEPLTAARLLDTFEGKLGVVGLFADNVKGQVVILEVYPNGAAERAGVRIGDVLVSIDGIVMESFTDSSEAGLLIRGEPGTEVDLEIRRGDEILHLFVEREQPSYVLSTMLNEDIGYIQLNAFNSIATQSMRDELSNLMMHSPKGLIWDLRSNEGGDMDSAKDILSLFIEDGVLFSAELTGDRTVEFVASGKPMAGEISLVVLIDESSISAAETCAAAIKELGRGMIVGTHSFGKGTIQATVPLADGTMLQLTIARWISASGEWYEGRGVQPDIEVFDLPETEVDELILKAVEILTISP